MNNIGLTPEQEEEYIKKERELCNPFSLISRVRCSKGTNGCMEKHEEKVMDSEDFNSILLVTNLAMFDEEAEVIGKDEGFSEVNYEDAAYWFRLGYTAAIARARKEILKNG